MLAFWVTLIKVIAPWVAAAVVIHYLNVYNEKKYPEFYNSDNENNPKSLFENLEIGYPFELAFIMYVGLLFFLICLIGAYVDDQLNWFTGGCSDLHFIWGVYRDIYFCRLRYSRLENLGKRRKNHLS